MVANVLGKKMDFHRRHVGLELRLAEIKQQNFFFSQNVANQLSLLPVVAAPSLLHHTLNKSSNLGLQAN